MDKKFKEVAFVLAGALVGVAFIPYKDTLSQIFLFIVFAIIFLIFLGIGGIEIIIKIWISINRKINNRKNEICIYAPYDIDIDTSSWVNISLRQFKQKMSDAKFKHCVKKSEKSFNLFPVVINPYGGVYPEVNTSNLTSLDNIFDYVRDGGIYVNIADIPFYYAYDINLKRKVDTTPLPGDFLQVRSFF